MAPLIVELSALLGRVGRRLNALVGRVTQPLLLGIIFYGLFTPLALLMRLCGRNPLELRRAEHLTTYWTARDPDIPSNDMRLQF